MYFSIKYYIKILEKYYFTITYSTAVLNLKPVPLVVQHLDRFSEHH